MRDLELNDVDKEIFDRLELQTVFKTDFPEAYRQNGIGSAYDAAIPGNWPVDLGEITIPVFVWHAEGDSLVGNMSAFIAQSIPNSKLTTLVGAGHLWIIENMAEVLAALTPPRMLSEPKTEVVSS